MTILDAIHDPQGQPAKWLDKVVTVLPDLTARFKNAVDELAVVTQGQVDKARTILRDLVGGEIRLNGAVDGAERFLTAELAGDYAGLLRLVAGPRLNLVMVTSLRSYRLWPETVQSPRARQ